jgi:hypothetical protein
VDAIVEGPNFEYATETHEVRMRSLNLVVQLSPTGKLVARAAMVM